MDSHLVRATRDAAVLALMSNILGQALKCQQSNISFTINTTDLFHFVLFAILSTPPNFVWQTWLESKFPGYTERRSAQEQSPGSSSEKPQKIADADRTPSHKQLNIRNTLTKFALDQTIGAAINTLLFIGGIALFRGKPAHVVANECQKQWWPLMSAGYKLWPAVSITSFLAVPVEYRTTFGGIIGLFWGVYLSLFSSSDRHE